MIWYPADLDELWVAYDQSIELGWSPSFHSPRNPRLGGEVSRSSVRRLYPKGRCGEHCGSFTGAAWFATSSPGVRKASLSCSTVFW